MSNIKIKDTQPEQSQNRKETLWRALEEKEIIVNSISDGKDIYSIRLNDKNLDKLADETLNHGFEIMKPHDYDSRKTIVVRKIDPYIKKTSSNKLIKSIEERNPGIRVTEIIKLPHRNSIIKIKLKEIGMVQFCKDNGLTIRNQHVEAHNIEKEIYITLIPCYRCYDYEHSTDECN